jgi:hypothetical protein
MDGLCVPDGGGLLQQECRNTLLSYRLGRHKTAVLVRQLAYWHGQMCDVVGY